MEIPARGVSIIEIAKISTKNAMSAFYQYSAGNGRAGYLISILLAQAFL